MLPIPMFPTSPTKPRTRPDALSLMRTEVLVEKPYTMGAAEVTERFEATYDEASSYGETNNFRQLHFGVGLRRYGT